MTLVTPKIDIRSFKIAFATEIVDVPFNAISLGQSENMSSTVNTFNKLDGLMSKKDVYFYALESCIWFAEDTYWCFGLTLYFILSF